MTPTTHTIELSGCAPNPLAHYLKALAILRLVAEQIDPSARGYWKNDQFHLVSQLSKPELVAFFLNDYQPSPIIAPWNNGGGFDPDGQRTAHETLQSIVHGQSPRHAKLRAAIHVGIEQRDLLGINGENAKLSQGDHRKTPLLNACRAHLADDALGWFDAAIVLLDDGPKYPPIVGTGGTEGKLDLTNNYLQQLNEVLSPESGSPTAIAESALQGALFNQPTNVLSRNAIGQFLPGSAGGANSANGFGGKAVINPWDFVFMMEGALLFASASSRRLESSSSGALSYPFTVRASGVGYGSSGTADLDKSRGEIWLPLWSEAALCTELRALFSEGRVTVNKRAAKNGIDFARAVASLGVDRGIVAFERTAFHERNGQSYFAIPLGRVPVHRNPKVDLLDEIDPWLNQLFRKANGKHTPQRITSAARNLEAAIFNLSTRLPREHSQNELQALLVALGKVHRALSISLKWTREAGIRPLNLKNLAWSLDTDDGSPEFRLARSLASLRGTFGDTTLHLREHVEPVQLSRAGNATSWQKNPSRDLVWNEGPLEQNLLAIFTRRLLAASQQNVSRWPDRGQGALLSDLAAFIEGRLNDARLTDLFLGLILCSKISSSKQASTTTDWGPDAIYALLKLTFSGHLVRGQDVPVNPAIGQNALHGNPRALQLAIQRLRASGVAPALPSLFAREHVLRRSYAAALFPISSRDVQRLETMFLRPTSLDYS